MPRLSHEQLAQQARFVFEGTVQQRGAATIDSVPVSDRTLIVHVNRILQAPQTLSAYLDKDITVQLGSSSRARLEPGQQAVFYTNGWLFGDSIAVRALGQLPLSQAQRAMLSQPATAGDATTPPHENLANRDLQQRLTNADAVVTGKVVGVRVPAETVADATAAVGARGGAEPTVVAPISEHDPEWREAVVEVQGTEKGSTDRSNVVVRFPSSNDVQWYRAPKFEAGQEGIFVLHQKQTQPVTAAHELAAAGPGEDEEVYTALDPADFQPTQQLPVVQTLLAASGQAPGGGR
jgi:hypothetical protein